jgi:Glycine/serine hydroxymethyltransferase
MEQVADMIERVLTNVDNDDVLAEVRQDVIALTKQFPLYPELAN